MPKPKAKPRVKPRATTRIENDGKAKGKKSSNSGGRANERFSEWVKSGYFDDEKTLRDVQNSFHEVGIIISQTSIPNYLLKAVRNGKLRRTKKKVGNKEVWVYRTASK